MESNDKLISAREAARLLGIKTPTLYQWTSRKAIPFVRISRNMIKFDPAELQAWIEARRVEEMGGHSKKRLSQAPSTDKPKNMPLPQADDCEPSKKPAKEPLKDRTEGSKISSVMKATLFRAWAYQEEKGRRELRSLDREYAKKKKALDAQKGVKLDTDQQQYKPIAEAQKGRIKWNGSREQFEALCRRLVEGDAYVLKESCSDGFLSGFIFRDVEQKGWDNSLPVVAGTRNKWVGTREELAYLYSLLTTPKLSGLIIETRHEDFIAAFEYLAKNKKWTNYTLGGFNQAMKKMKGKEKEPTMQAIIAIVIEVSKLGLHGHVT